MLLGRRVGDHPLLKPVAELLHKPHVRLLLCEAEAPRALTGLLQFLTRLRVEERVNTVHEVPDHHDDAHLLTLGVEKLLERVLEAQDHLQLRVADVVQPPWPERPPPAQRHECVLLRRPPPLVAPPPPLQLAHPQQRRPRLLEFMELRPHQMDPPHPRVPKPPRVLEQLPEAQPPEPAVASFHPPQNSPPPDGRVLEQVLPHPEQHPLQKKLMVKKVTKRLVPPEERTSFKPQGVTCQRVGR